MRDVGRLARPMCGPRWHRRPFSARIEAARKRKARERKEEEARIKRAIRERKEAEARRIEKREDETD